VIAVTSLEDTSIFSTQLDNSSITSVITPTQDQPMPQFLHNINSATNYPNANVKPGPHQSDKNKTETKLKLLSTHTSDKTQIFSGRFNFILPCAPSVDSCSYVNTSRGASSKMKKKMKTHAWLRLASYSSHQNYQKKKKKKRRFRVRPTLSKRKIYDGDELLVDLRNDDVGLSGELPTSFKNFFRMSSENFENLMCLVGPAFQKKNTNFRYSIGVTERLAVTLRFLATGDS
jgi:hypothetical protein